jgi:phage gp37-like protein
MSVIRQVEDALLAEVDAALADTVRVKQTLGGSWTLDALKRALQTSPGVYAAFLGARQVGRNTESSGIDGRFAVYIVAKASSDPIRRRGTPHEIGAYDMLERLAPRLGGLTVPGVGSCELTAIENLFRDALFDVGGTVYGLMLTLPRMPLPPALDTTVLDNFATYRADSNPGGPDTPAMPTELTLETLP